VPLQCNLSFLDESLSNVWAIFPDFLALEERFRLREAEPESDNEHGRTCAKPKQLDFVRNLIDPDTSEVQLTGRQPWRVVFTKPLAKAVARRYPKA
jgi:hypothetical protein